MFTNGDAGVDEDAEENKGVAADGAVDKDGGVSGKDEGAEEVKGVAADGAVDKDGGVSGKDEGAEKEKGVATDGGVGKLPKSISSSSKSETNKFIGDAGNWFCSIAATWSSFWA